MDYHYIDSKLVMEKLNTNLNGLSKDDVKNRINKYGKNELPKGKKDGIIKMFFKEFLSPIVIVMIVCAIFSIIAGEVVDEVTIFVIIILDALFGAIQEKSAGDAAEKLEQLIKVKARVIRDGKEKMISSDELVPGDIVLLESGSKISCDMRIIDSLNLTVDESVLTGESISKEKNGDVAVFNSKIQDMSNMVFAGCSVITGRATCVVVETGANTEIGKISSKVIESKSEKSPLVIRMEKLTKQITFLIVVVALIVTILLLLKGNNLNEIFTSVVALSVSAMPEGLPLALTLALTIASSRMATKNVIVKRLNSVEALGSCTVIASDKTGTLTVNEQTAKKILLPDSSLFEIEGAGYNTEGEVKCINGSKLVDAMEISKLGAVNNEATFVKEGSVFKTTGDTIDIAFLALSHKLNLNTTYKEVARIPYESEKKYSAVFYEEDGNVFCTVKGSVEKVLSFCDSMDVSNKIQKLDIEHIKSQNSSLASEGYRVIAIAKSRKVDGPIKNGTLNDTDIPKLIFKGLVAFIDPVRDGAKDAVLECKKAGIKVIMITGDHPLTAYAIAKGLNICENYDEVASDNEIDEYLMKGEKTFDKYVKNHKVFTRVSPLQKLEIVSSLKRSGEFVAVTGDGVNDSPAIKNANIGIAMGSGTDVAKEASNMIIIDDNFSSIVKGIEEGRASYSNIRKVVYLLISCGLSEVFFFTLSILFNLEVPLLAIQLLWLNIVTDGFQDMALSFEKEEKEVMYEKPRNPKESIFNKIMFEEVIISGLTIGLVVFGVWFYLQKFTDISIEMSRTYIMLLMVFMQNVHVLNCRSEKKSALSIPLTKNMFIVYSILLAIVLQIIVMEIPMFNDILKTVSIDPLHILYMFLLSLPVLIVMEIYKKFRFKKGR